MTHHGFRFAAAGLAATLAALVAGCDQPTGPLLGEWRGQSPGGSQSVPKTVDVTLDGAPGAMSGAYQFSSQENDPTLLAGHDQRNWSGTWVRTDRVVDGHTIGIYRLQRLLSGEIDTYALEPDGTMRPVDPNGQIDVTPAGSHDTLSPVPPHKPLL